MQSGFYQVGFLLLAYVTLQGATLSGTLPFQKKGRPSANILLAVLIVLIGLLSGQLLVMFMGWHTEALYLAFPIGYIRYAIGPILISYINEVLYLKRQQWWKWMLHSIPMVMMAALSIYYYLLLGPEASAIRIDELLASRSTTLPASTYFFMITNKLHPVIYAIVAVIKLSRFESENRHYRSYNSTLISWLKTLAIILISTQVLAILAVIVFFINDFYTLYLDILSIVLTAVIVQFVALSVMRTPERMFPAKIEMNTAAKSPKSDVDLTKKITALMEGKKPYLDPGLKLSDLADMLHIPMHTVSHQINSSFGQNFFDFVNGYRVEEVKSRMKVDDNRHLTILGIAFESGFNSKASFNRIFKKQTGQTPSKFMRSIMQTTHRNIA